MLRYALTLLLLVAPALAQQTVSTSQPASSVTSVTVSSDGLLYTVIWVDGTTSSVLNRPGTRDYDTVQAWIALGNAPGIVPPPGPVRATVRFESLIALQMRRAALSAEMSANTTDNTALQILLNATNARIAAIRAAR